LSPESIAVIRTDTTLTDAVRRVAVRLAENHLRAAEALRKEKLAVLRETTRQKLDDYRQAAAAPNATAQVLNDYAWALATMDPQIASEFPDASQTAIELAKKAVEKSPHWGRFWDTLGYAHYRASNWQAAIDALEKATTLRQEGATEDWLFVDLAMAHLKLGHTDEATAAYREAVRQSPKNANLFNSLAWMLATATDPKLRDPGQAVEFAKRATELAPDDGSIWNTLGVAQYRAGEWQLAIDALNSSLKLRNGGDSADWFFVAMARWQLGHKDEARQWYDKAVEWMDKNAPKNEELLRFRAEAAELLGIAEPQPSTDPGDQPPSPQPADQK
jgi:tetratricopeptide (TPR) repeat protein